MYFKYFKIAHDDDTLRLGGDSSGAVNAIKQLNTALKSLTESINSSLKNLKGYNTGLDATVAKLKATPEGFTAFKTATEANKKVVDSFLKSFDSGAKLASSKLNRFKQDILKQLLLDSSGTIDLSKKNRDYLNKLIGLDSTKLKEMASRVRSEANAALLGIAIEVTQAFEQVGSKGASAAQKANARILKQQQKDKETFLNFVKDEVKRRRELQVQAARDEQAELVGGRLRGEAGPLMGGLTSTKVNAAQRNIDTIVRAVRSGKISLQDFEQIFSDLMVNPTTLLNSRFDSISQSIRKVVNLVLTEKRRLSEGSSLTNSAAIQRGNAALHPILNNSPPLPNRVNIDSFVRDLQDNHRTAYNLGRPQDSKALEAQFEALRKLVDQGKITVARMREIYDELGISHHRSYKGIEETTAQVLRNIRITENRFNDAKRAEDLKNQREAETAINKFNKRQEQTAKNHRKVMAELFSDQIHDLLGANAQATGRTPVASRVSTLENATRSMEKLITKTKDGERVLLHVHQLLSADPKKTPMFSGVSAEFANGLRKIENALKDVYEENQKFTHGISISWQGLIRILQVQILHTVIGTIINQMRASVEQAAKLQVAISEIRTISQDAQQTTRAWTDQLRQLSDAFALPAADVANATYEAVSNQIAKGAEATRFMNDALKFAKTTVSSATDAVNLLSSVMNAYGLKTHEAERISALMFQTIDKGRIRAKDLANTVGVILPLASKLGIRLEEVSAALATITIQGVEVDTSITSFKNIMAQLLKPSKEMEELFKKWGVGSGQAAISTLGFTEVLSRLNQELQTGGAGHLAELAPDLRGLQGLVALTGRSLKDYNKFLDDTGEAEKRFAEATKIAMESEGFDHLKEMNKIMNVITQDLGGTLVTILNRLNNAGFSFSETVKLIGDSVLSIVRVSVEWGVVLGKIDTSFGYLLGGGSAFKRFSTIIPELTAVITGGLVPAMGVGMAYASLTMVQSMTSGVSALTLLGANLKIVNGTLIIHTTLVNTAKNAWLQLLAFAKANPITTILFAVGAAITYVLYEMSILDEKIKQTKQETVNSLRDLDDELMKAFEKNQLRQLDLFTKGEKTKLTEYNQNLATQRQELSSHIDKILEIDNEWLTQLETKFAGIHELLKKSFKDFDQYRDHVRSQIEGSLKHIQHLKEKADLRIFERSLIGKNPFQEIEMSLETIKNIEEDIQKLRDKGPSTIEQQRKLYGEIEKIVVRTNDKIHDSLKDADKFVKELVREREENIFETKFDASDNVATKRALATSRVNQLIKESRDFFEQGYSGEGRARAREAIRLARRLNSAENTGKKSGTTGNQLETKVLTELKGLVTDFSTKIGPKLIDEQEKVKNQIASEEAFIKSALDTLTELKNSNQKIKDLDALVKTETELMTRIKDLTDAIVQAFNLGTGKISSAIGGARTIQEIVRGRVGLDNPLVVAKTTDQTRKLQQLLTQAKAETRPQERLELLKEAGLLFNKMSSELRNSPYTENLKELTKALNSLREELMDAKEATQIHADKEGEKQGFASGGYIGGRYARRGVDNQLVRAQRGEFIVNAEATALFRRQLEDMNQGRYPSWVHGGRDVAQRLLGIHRHGPKKTKSAQTSTVGSQGYTQARGITVDRKAEISAAAKAHQDEEFEKIKNYKEIFQQRRAARLQEQRESVERYRQQIEDQKWIKEQMKLNPGGGGFFSIQDKGFTPTIRERPIVPNSSTNNHSTTTVGDIHIHLPKGSTEAHAREIGYKLERAVNRGTIRLNGSN